MTQVKKQHSVIIKKAEGKSVVALVSVFGNVDHAGDRVLSGAFTKSIERWRRSGAPVPFIWAHRWDDPMAHVGKVDPRNIRETERGLLVEAEIDQDTEFSVQVMRLLRERRVKEFSFSYDIVNERKAPDGANDLVELDLIECGPALRGMNSETELISAKSLGSMLAREVQDPVLAALNAQLDALAPSEKSDVDRFVEETREIMAQERAEADALAQRMSDLDAAEAEVRNDNTSGDELLSLLFPAARRLQREDVDADV